MFKNIDFLKYIIELPEKQKTWAVVVLAAIIIYTQNRLNQSRELEYRKEAEVRIEKLRAEKNAEITQKDAVIQTLNNMRIEDMKDFKTLWFETERLKQKIKQDENFK